MRRNDMSVGEAIQFYLKQNGLTEKVDVERVISEWPKIMGKAIAENTEQLWFRSGVFYVKMKTPIWKNELSLGKSKIKDFLNQEIGHDLIQEVKVI